MAAVPHHSVQHLKINQINQSVNENSSVLPKTQIKGSEEPTQIQQQQQQKQQKEMQQQPKLFDMPSLCKIGHDTVQDIVTKVKELFQILSAIQATNGTFQSENYSNEKKVKVQELLHIIRLRFKMLHLIYDECNENGQLEGMDYVEVESLIPFKDEVAPKHDEKNIEAHVLAYKEKKDLMEKVLMKNCELKEVINHLRTTIREINLMLTMERSQPIF